MVVTGKELDDLFFLTIRNLLKCLHDNIFLESCRFTADAVCNLYTFKIFTVIIATYTMIVVAIMHNVIPVSKPPMKDPPTASAEKLKLLAQLSLHASVIVNFDPFTSRETAE